MRVGRYFLRGQRDRVLPARLFHGVKVSVTRVYADRHPPGAPGRPRPAEEASRVRPAHVHVNRADRVGVCQNP